MTKRKSRRLDHDSWEAGELGLDEAFVKVTDATEAAETDGALELKMISIRLQNHLINKLKLIAKFHGTGYQPLMRDALQRFACDELLRIAEELDKNKKLKHISNALNDADQDLVVSKNTEDMFDKLGI